MLGKSQFVRSQDGKKRYRAAEGPDAPLLQFVLTAMEPLPATDALFAESDWKVQARRGGRRGATRVASGTRRTPAGRPTRRSFTGSGSMDRGSW